MVMKIFIARHGHEWSSLAGNPRSAMSAHTTYESAVRRVHKHFMSRGFILIDDRPWDSGCSSATPTEASANPEDEGFLYFGDTKVEVIDGMSMVSSFCHADGDGPVGDVIEMELV